MLLSFQLVIDEQFKIFFQFSIRYQILFIAYCLTLAGDTKYYFLGLKWEFGTVRFEAQRRSWLATDDMFLPAAAFITNLLLTNVSGEETWLFFSKCFENNQEQVAKSCKKSQFIFMILVSFPRVQMCFRLFTTLFTVFLTQMQAWMGMPCRCKQVWLNWLANVVSTDFYYVIFIFLFVLIYKQRMQIK